MKAINVGLIGCGTVGSGTAKILLEKRNELGQKTDVDFILKKVCDKDFSKARNVVIPKEIKTTNANDVLDDEGIDIVVELIGGINPAKEIILTALRNGKHVVTANKALLAEYGIEIFSEAKKRNRAVGYEASVCGGIPIIKSLSEGLVANDIRHIFGIVNGTCNYILTKMSEEKISFVEALKLAQGNGFAEANPGLDVDGIDSMHKLILLVFTAYGATVRPAEVFTEGISEITPQDIKFANDLNYCIKLLAIIKKTAAGLEIRVNPTMIPKTHMLANVMNEFNALFIDGDAVGTIMFYGKGAGMMPTASAVVADIIEIGQKILFGSNSFCKTDFKTLEIKDMEAIESNYYLRFTVVDKPGVLAQISKILGENNVSIASVIQKEENKEIVPLIVITHKSLEGQVQKAVQDIDKLECVKNKTILIRIEKD